MLALIILCFLNLLEHPEVLGYPPDKHGGSRADMSSFKSSFKYSDRHAGYLPPSEYEYYNSKTKRSTFKRSAGRQVDLPASAVQEMMNKPISYLDPSNGINKQEILDCHNKYRSKTNPPASNMLKLEWSEEAAKTACAWAKKCIQGHSDITDRTIPGFRCGENIMLSPVKIPWYVVIDCWYSEFADFKLEKGSVNGYETGHYTQLVWATSAKVGCGVAECPNLVNKFNMVCHYCPPGNRGNKTVPYKPGKPCADCPNSCSNNLCTNPCPWMDTFSDCKSYKKGPTCGNDASLINDCPAVCNCNKGEIK